jgi:hypothetical protein
MTKDVPSQANSRGFWLNAMVPREDHNTVEGLSIRKAEKLTGWTKEICSFCSLLILNRNIKIKFKKESIHLSVNTVVNLQAVAGKEHV